MASKGVDPPSPSSDRIAAFKAKLEADLAATLRRRRWFFMLLEGAQVSSAFSNDSIGIDALLPRLCALPGCDASQVTLAMGSSDNARFVCWERAAQASRRLV